MTTKKTVEKPKAKELNKEKPKEPSKEKAKGTQAKSPVKVEKKPAPEPKKVVILAIKDEVHITDTVKVTEEPVAPVSKLTDVKRFQELFQVPDASFHMRLRSMLDNANSPSLNKDGWKMEMEGLIDLAESLGFGPFPQMREYLKSL